MSQLGMVEQEGWATSLAKAWGDSIIQAGSETAGGAISKGLGKAVSKLPFGSKLVNALKRSYILQGGKPESFARKILTKTGYSNIIGEMGEERLATILTEIANTNDFGTPESGPIGRVMAGLMRDAENIGVEAVVLSVPTVGGTAVNFTVNKIREHKISKRIAIDDQRIRDIVKAAYNIKNADLKLSEGVITQEDRDNIELSEVEHLRELYPDIIIDVTERRIGEPQFERGEVPEAVSERIIKISEGEGEGEGVAVRKAEPTITALDKYKQQHVDKQVVLTDEGDVIAEKSSTAAEQWILNKAEKLQRTVQSTELVPSIPVLRDAYIQRRLRDIKRQQRTTREVVSRRKERKEDKRVIPVATAARFALNRVDSKHGTLMYPIYDRMQMNARRASTNARQAVMNMLGDLGRKRLLQLEPQDNDNIATWLYTPPAESTEEGEPAYGPKEEAWDNLSANGKALALVWQKVLQSPEVIREVQLMRFRDWDLFGHRPPNIETYFPGEVPRDVEPVPDIIKDYVPNYREQEKIPAAPYQHSLLAMYRDAKKAGQEREFINSLPLRLGIREYYYMSQPATNSNFDAAIDDVIHSVRIGAIDEPGTKFERPPGTTLGEVRTRRGAAGPKAGSVANNIMNHFQRISIANAIADDVVDLYNELGQIRDVMTSEDYTSLRQLIDSTLRKPEVVREPFKTIRKGIKHFWRARLSLLFRPHTALSSSFRNLLQTQAYAVGAINIKEGSSNLADMVMHIAKGGNLESYDPTLARYIDEHFESDVSERHARYTEFLFRDFAETVETAAGSKQAVRQMLALLDRSGFLYGAADEYGRNMVFTAQYLTTKKAIQRFLASKQTRADYEKFLKSTKLDTYMDTQQDIIELLINDNRVEEAAIQAARWAVEDIHFRYGTAERSLLEQTVPQRVIGGLYQFPRATVELHWNHGLKPMIEGMREGNRKKAWRGASNFIKLNMTSFITGSFLAYFGIRRSYDLLTQVAYSGLDPATGQVINLMDQVSMSVNKYMAGEQGAAETINEILVSPAARSIELLTIPLLDEILDVYEAQTDTAGRGLYQILRDTAQRALGIEPKELPKVKRSSRQKIMHMLLGRYEYVPQELTKKGMPEVPKLKKLPTPKKLNE